MTLDEAIKLLKGLLPFVEPVGPPEDREAVQLGIEALERLQELRGDGGYFGVPLLPGETREQ